MPFLFSVPADKPESFMVDESAIGATDAVLKWKAVRNDTKLIKGFFVGYLVSDKLNREKVFK
jgi:hypothetical protein